MRIFFLLFTFQISIFCFGQNNLVGIYSDFFGEKIELLSDSTFKHTYRFDLSSSWTKGKWRTIKDTLYLESILILDTLQIRNSENQFVKDSLVLSVDDISNRINNEEFAVSLISGGGQNRVKPPIKLFLRNRKLFRLTEDGTIDKRKLKNFWTQKKYKTYYIKESE